MRIVQTRVPLLLLILALLLPAGRARADARSDARRHFREGMSLIQAGRVDAGVRELQAAYELMPHPAVLYNIAKAWADAGELERALEYFDRYLATEPPDAAEVASVAEQLRARVVPAQAPSGPPPPRATAEELAALDESADQIEQLAEVTGSDVLRERARSLRALADTLRARRDRAESARKPQEGLTPVAATTGNGAAAGGPIASEAELGEMDLAESLLLEVAPQIGLDVYEEQVVSAGRFAQSVLDAPYSTTVVTAQDIRLSGLTNVAELLRRAAGVEVMTLTPGNTEVSIRGLNQRLSNKVLVLVDGRSVFLDFLGATMWSSLPITIEDIERIELIRGPASALYGADAFTGIVNIITRRPGEGATSASVGVGDAGQLRAVMSVSGRSERGPGWRFGAGFEQADQYSLMADPQRVDVTPYADDPDLGLRRTWASLDLLQPLGRGWELGGGAGVSTFDLAFQAISRLRELYARDGFFSQTHAQLKSPYGLSMRVYWNYFQSDVGNAFEAPGSIPVAVDDIRSHAADAELVWSRRIEGPVAHELAMGLGFRFKAIQFDWLDADHYENHVHLFLEDKMQLGSAMQFSLSGRVDRHPLLDELQFSPRGSLVLRPHEQLALRLTAGSAFRSPTFLESYLRFENQTPYRGVTALGLGNRELAPENIFSGEGGLTWYLGDVASFEANGYYNMVSNQILLSQITPYRLEDYPGYQDDVAAHPIGALQFGNDEAMFRQLGAETGLRYFPVRGLDLYANYAWHDTAPNDPDARLDGRELDQRTSRHKVNAGVQYRTGLGLDLALDGHFVGRQVWVEQVTDPASGVRFEDFEIDPYLLVNARVGWRFLDDGLEVGVVGTNLLDQAHREHPFGQMIRRRIMGTATVRF